MLTESEKKKKLKQNKSQVVVAAVIHAEYVWNEVYKAAL